MRFPTHAGGLASVTLSVTSIEDALPFWRGVLHALGYGRIYFADTFLVFARDGAQFCLSQRETATANITVILNARSRDEVDAVHALAMAQGWPVRQPPKDGHIAPGYYDCVLSPPGQPSVRLAIAHAWDDLPEHDGATKIRLSGADDGVTLGGYLFCAAEPSAAAIIALGGYGSNAHDMTFLGPILHREGWHALLLSQRGWLGSTGDEDQGYRQQLDLVAASDWLLAETRARRVAYLGYSQGGQVCLLAAAAGQRPAAVVAYYPPTDMEAWAATDPKLRDYLDDFVPPERRAAVSPVTVAHRIMAPTLLIHGDQDVHVPLSQSEALVRANPAIGLQVIAGGTHGLYEQFETHMPMALAFLRLHLNGKSEDNRNCEP